MTEIDTRVRPVFNMPVQRGPQGALASHQVVCAPVSHPVQRIAVLTTGAASRELASAVRKVVTGNEIVRFIERNVHLPVSVSTTQSAGLQGLTPWWEWADVVITDADDDSIAESVECGFVPAVAMPKKRFGSSAARHALTVAHPWSSRGLAMHLCLENPALRLLQCAANMRTAPRAAATGVVWNNA